MKENIYDNSNIAESYAGATTPLTFSFVRYVYQEAYQYFSHMMGADEKLVKENKEMFGHMVEFIGYRIYYNLNSWYKMLSFFPAHHVSGEFMEKMMGVDTHHTVREKQQDFCRKYFLYLPKTILQTIKISLTFIFLGWRIKKFNAYFDKAFLEMGTVDFSTLTLDELKNSYKKLDAQLLSRWRVPIANDFALMVSAGLADMLFKKWLSSDDAYSHMRPTVNITLVSLDPGKDIRRIVDFIKADNATQELFGTAHSEEDILKLLREKFSTHIVSREIEEYLKKFGARIPNELKLESETLTENPENLILLVRTALQGRSAPEKIPKTEPAENVYQNLSFPKRIFLKWLLRWAGNSIYRREDARFRRTLVFGHVRKIFLAIGKKMEQNRYIANERDVFYLSVEEIFNLIDRRKKDPELFGVIEQRKRLFEKWKKIELPRRFETTKSIAEIEQQVLNSSFVSHKKLEGQLTGTVASRPNNMPAFSGVAITLKDFDPAANFEGKILVTCQTDPGWTIIFPLLKGIVVERGGMLSHAAIVARELNIPCIVGVEHATEHIPDGTRITLDLQTGFVKEI